MMSYGFYAPDGRWLRGSPPLPLVLDPVVPEHLRRLCVHMACCGWTQEYLTRSLPQRLIRDMGALFEDQRLRDGTPLYSVLPAVGPLILRALALYLAACADDEPLGIERDQYGYRHWPEQRAWITALGMAHGCAFLDRTDLERAVRTRYWNAVARTLATLEGELPGLAALAKKEHLVIQIGTTGVDASLGPLSAAAQYNPAQMSPHGRPQITLARPLQSTGHELAHFLDDCLAPNVPGAFWYASERRGGPVRAVARALLATPAHEDLLLRLRRVRSLDRAMRAALRAYLDEPGEIVARFTDAVLRSRAGRRPRTGMDQERWTRADLVRFWPPLRAAFAALL